MKSGNLLFSAAQFVFCVLVILLGGFFIGLEHAPMLRYSLADFFSRSQAPFSFIGYFILSGGFMLLISFYFMNRGHYYQLKMGKREVYIDPAIVQGYIQEYWSKIFPEHNLDISVSITRSQVIVIQMAVEIPPLSEERQQAVLEKAESDLEQMLMKRLGYQKEFFLSVLVK